MVSRLRLKRFPVFRVGVSLLLLYGLSHGSLVRLLFLVARINTEDCRLLFYTPSATVVRLLTTNALIAYITNCVLYLSGASKDPRMLLPAWVSIATVRFTLISALLELGFYED